MSGPVLIDESNAWKCRGQSDSLKDFTDTTPDKVVMWTQFPHANSNLSMSRWHQFMIASLQVQLDDTAVHQYHRECYHPSGDILQCGYI